MRTATRCRARALIVSENHAEEVAGLADELPDLEHVIVRDAGYDGWLGAQTDEDPRVPISPDDYFIIRHTGGTTGLSKGVAYTHKAWLAAGRDWFYAFPPVEPGDKCLHLGPISHGSGYQYLPIWLSGGCNVMMDHFDTQETLDIIEREGIAYGFMVPTMVNAIVHDNTARGRNLSSVKCLLIGAAPIQDATALAAREVFGDVLWQGYGQTEVVPVSMMGPRQWFAEVEGSSPLRACGLPLLLDLEPTAAPAADGTDALVITDDSTGRLVLSPGPQRIREFESSQREREERRSHERSFLARGARTADGVAV